MTGISSAVAEPIGRSRAEALAKEFINKRCSMSASLKCMPARKGAKAQVSNTEKLYVFNIGDNGGFVVVAGDDKAIPVLGYAETGTFDPENIPDNMAAWLRMNEAYVDMCAQNGTPQQDKALHTHRAAPQRTTTWDAWQRRQRR